MTQSSFSSGDSLSISERSVSDRYDFTLRFTVGIPITMVTEKKTKVRVREEGEKVLKCAEREAAV